MLRFIHIDFDHSMLFLAILKETTPIEHISWALAVVFLSGLDHPLELLQASSEVSLFVSHLLWQSANRRTRLSSASIRTISCELNSISTHHHSVVFSTCESRTASKQDSSRRKCTARNWTADQCELLLRWHSFTRRLPSYLRMRETHLRAPGPTQRPDNSNIKRRKQLLQIELRT